MEGLVKDSKKRFTEIDCLRGIAIILVVIGHSFFDKTDFLPQSVIFNAIYNFHMPLFFAISGFCFINYAGAGVLNFFKKKLIRILVPYLFLAFFSLFGKYMLPNIAKNSYSLENWWHILLGIPPMGPLWFLWSLFAVMLIYSVAFFKNKKINYFIVLPVSLALFLFYPLTGGALEGVLKVCRYQFYFLIGLFLRERYKGIKDFVSGIKDIYKIIVSFISISIIILIALFNPFLKLNSVATIVLSTVFGVVGFYILSCYISKTKAAKIFTELSEYSMDIYILSYFVVLVLEIIYRKIDTNVPYIYWTMVIACVICGLVIPYFVSKYIVRKIPIVRTLVLGYLPVK